MIDVRTFLREETCALHHELDALVGTFLSCDDYARFLLGTFRHRIPVERGWLDAAAALGMTSYARILQQELKSDLADLGLAAPATSPFYVPNSVPSLLGAAYVLEGSALGARILVKRAEPIGFGSEFGARYLTAQALSLQHWTVLMAALTSLDRQEWTSAAQSAREVFSHAIQAFKIKELMPHDDR